MEKIQLTYMLDFIDNLADSFQELRDDQRSYALICLVHAEGILDKGRTFIMQDEEQKAVVRQRIDASRAKISSVISSFDPVIAKQILEGESQNFSSWVK